MHNVRCKCGRQHTVALLPLQCQCGTKHPLPGKDAPTPPAKPLTKPICDHRLPQIGFSKCGCDGNVTVYGCSIHSFCMQRPIRVGQQTVEFFDRKPRIQKVTMPYCKGCPDFGSSSNNSPTQ